MTLKNPPLDGILKAQGLDNADLIKASTQQLTFKQLQKARSGKQVSINIQQKIMNALNACGAGSSYKLKDLF